MKKSCQQPKKQLTVAFRGAAQAFNRIVDDELQKQAARVAKTLSRIKSLAQKLSTWSPA